MDRSIGRVSVSGRNQLMQLRHVLGGKLKVPTPPSSDTLPGLIFRCSNQPPGIYGGVVGDV